jgi:hypothetical protein
MAGIKEIVLGGGAHRLILGSDVEVRITSDPGEARDLTGLGATTLLIVAQPEDTDEPTDRASSDLIDPSNLFDASNTEQYYTEFLYRAKDGHERTISGYVYPSDSIDTDDGDQRVLIETNDGIRAVLLSGIQGSLDMFEKPSRKVEEIREVEELFSKPSPMEKVVTAVFDDLEGDKDHPYLSSGRVHPINVAKIFYRKQDGSYGSYENMTFDPANLFTAKDGRRAIKVQTKDDGRWHSFKKERIITLIKE